METENINVNATNNDIETPLHLAVQAENVSMVKLLLETKGINVNAVNQEKNTVLHLAVESNNLKILKILMDSKNINANAQNKSSYCPLYLAIKSENLNVVQLLLKYEDVVVENCYYKFHLINLAVNIGNADILKLLLKTLKSTDLDEKNYNGLTLLHLAAKSGDVKILKILLKAGADLDVTDKYANDPFNIIMNELRKPPSIKIRNRYLKCLSLILEYIDLDTFYDGSESNLVNILKLISNDKYKSTYKIIIQHVAKLKELKNTFDPRILNVISSIDNYKNYFTDCEQELTRAKDTKLQNCWVTFFNLLVDSKLRLLKYAGNQDLIQDFDRTVRKFPIYGNAMRSNVSKGIGRRKLWDCAASSLSYNLPIFNPTQSIIKDVLDNLRKRD